MSSIKYRCRKCKKEFNVLKESYCCKNKGADPVALGMTMEEIKKMIEESNLDVYDWLFEHRQDIERKSELIDRMRKAIKISVRELNILEYTL